MIGCRKEIGHAFERIGARNDSQGEKEESRRRRRLSNGSRKLNQA
jgi:hypothetical protein